MSVDQFGGLTDSAKNFLTKNGVEVKTRIHCALHRYILKNGGRVDEFIQCRRWNDGLVFFLGLRHENGTEYMWSEDDIDDSGA